jgi:hypothetical protein
MGFAVQTNDSSSSPIIKTLSVVGGLLAAAVVAFCLDPPPRHFLSWSELFNIAAKEVIAVSLACVVTLSTIYRTMKGKSTTELHWLLARTSLVALWFAPLALLVRRESFWSLPVAALLAIWITRFLQPSQSQQPALDPSQPFSLLHDECAVPSLKFRPLTSYVATLCAQAGTLLALAGYIFPAVLLIAAGFAIWTWFSPRSATLDDPQRSLPSPFDPRSLLAVALVLAITIGALMSQLGGGGFGLFAGSSPRHAQHEPSHGSQEIARGRTPTSSPQDPNEGDSGIILWPEKQTYTKLVAPVPARLIAGATTSRNLDPLIIPFKGVYWFYKEPDQQPPKASRQAHASPETVNIRSTDRRPLSIEARDYLGNRIDLDCCSRIQIAIRNADRYPETVSLELVLVDTSLPGKPSISLGRNLVRSTRPWNIYGTRPPVSETLNFAIPRSASVRRFDEVRIVFRLDRVRADSGARIAIDHFVLVPRNL